MKHFILISALLALVACGPNGARKDGDGTVEGAAYCYESESCTNQCLETYPDAQCTGSEQCAVYQAERQRQRNQCFNREI